MSDLHYPVKCHKCNNKIELKFSRNNMKVFAVCSNCNTEFELQSKDLELAFYRQYFKEQNSNYINNN